MNDRGLLGSDFRKRVAEIFLMIERDGCERNHFGACGGCRVEPSAKAGFENRQFNARFFEGDEGDGRDVLEEGGQRGERASIAQAFSRHANDCREPRKLTFGNLRAVDADAFGNRDEMRRSIEAGGDARRACDGFEHDGGRAFAVRPSNLNFGISPLWLIQRGEQAFRILQAELHRDSFMAETEQVMKRFVKIHKTVMSDEPERSEV